MTVIGRQKRAPASGIQSRQERYAARPVDNRVSVAVDRLQRRVSEATERLSAMSPLTVPENTGLVGIGQRGARPLAPDFDPGFNQRLVHPGGDA